jgi:MinD-like ATPase involved in chromosome partitioning or flagellar assembly
MAGPLVVVTCSLGSQWETGFVRAAAHPALGVHVGARCGDPGQALGLAMRDEPFAVIADAVPGWWDLDTVQRLAACGTALVVIGGPVPTGAVAPESEAPEAIAAALLRLDAEGEAPMAPEPTAAPCGELVAVWGGAGAPGRTTVAIHLAAAAAARRADVLLMDADVWSASVAQRLDLDDGRGIVHAARAASSGADPLDRTVAARGPLAVMPGLARPELWTEVGEAAFLAVLDAVRQRYGMVVVDLAAPIEEDEALSFDRVPFRRNLVTRTVLERADRVVYVVAGDPIGIRRARQAHDALHQELPAVAPQLDVVVNRVPHGREREIADSVRTLLGLPTSALVPPDRAADRALWRGCLTRDVVRNSPLWSASVRIAEGWAA